MGRSRCFACLDALVLAVVLLLLVFVSVSVGALVAVATSFAAVRFLICCLLMSESNDTQNCSGSRGRGGRDRL